MNPQNKQDSKTMIYGPQQVSDLGIRQLDEFRKNPGSGVLPGFPGLDKLIPWRAIVAVMLGYTNHGKTTLMDLIATNNIPNMQENEIIVKIDLENSIEEQVTKEISLTSGIPIPTLVQGKTNDAEWKNIMDAAMERATKPIWLLGHSEQEFRRRQRASVPIMWDALNHIVDSQEKKIKLIVIDYFQRIRKHKSGDARICYMDMMDMLADIALGFGCPVLLGSQAKRDVNDRKIKVPTIQDSQETSNLEQTGKTIMCTYMPHKDLRKKEKFEFAGNTFTVTDNLLIFGVLKQKGPCPIYKAYNFNHDTKTLTEITNRHEGQEWLHE